MRHVARNRGGLGTEILLIDDAVLVNDERHYPRVAVSRRKCNYSEAAGHVAIDDIALGAAGRVRPLAFEGLVVIAVIGLRLVFLAEVTGGACLANQRTQGALLVTRACRPIEPIMLARGT